MIKSDISFRGILLSIVSEERVNNFIETIKDKESDESMFLLPERVKTWYNEDIAKAKNEGMEKGKNNELLQLAKKMIKDKMDIKLIQRYTGFTAKQIEELKKVYFKSIE